ncbi:hypothetical protein FHETE_11088 [Fusarium heterosporum]|uniref:Proteoglycan n=1 Tax=Fusarium heterosporum TaxID=42747 RepID=A0A8H5WBA9_FUSHE|nr:hypothetical protein FHETE_11088 [Fusarium heterosporum]
MKPSNRLGAFWALHLSLVPSVLAAASCSQLTGSIYTGPNGDKFDISCDTSIVNGNIFAYYSDGDEFQDCVDRCDAVSICVSALYLSGSGDCALINSYQGTRPYNGNDVAIKRTATSETTTSTEFTSTVASSNEVISTEVSSAETSSIEVTSTEASSTEVTSIGDSSTETSSIRVTSTEVTSKEVISTEVSSTETSSIEVTSTEASSTEVTSIGDSSTETSSIELTSTGTSSTEVTSFVVTPTVVSLTETLSTEEVASTEATSTTASAATSSESSPNSRASTLATTTTDSPYTSTASVEASTNDCDDETSTIESSIFKVTSTATGSMIQPTTLSTDILSSSVTTLQASELSTCASSEASASTSFVSSLTIAETPNSISKSLPSSLTSETLPSLPASSKNSVTETLTTYTQVASSSYPSSETTDLGYKTHSASDVFTVETKSASRMTTPYPTSDYVWTVYLTMVEYITCSTGLVPQTVTTTTYVTTDGQDGSHKPPVVTLPPGCIGGYQIDASGQSYPVARPTKELHGNDSDRGYGQSSVRPTPAPSSNSHPAYENGKPHVPAPTAESPEDSEPEYSNGLPSVPQSTQESHGNSSDNKYSQAFVPGRGSPEPDKKEPQQTQNEASPTAISAYGPRIPTNSLVSSIIHHGQTDISRTFTIKTTPTEERQASSATSSAREEIPSTPVIASGANRHQGMVWTVIASTLITLRIYF